ncbi:MAG: MotA/TolQ/ExbB proton channel family protein [Candidatus Methylacidiphilales bacterium]|nr:MotA/TolQ/ExbB proton channel family protein [Candidatus Methylacidiphilales bacterium]
MTTSGVFEIIQLGGPIMWALFACSVVGLGVFVERLIHFHRCSMPVEPFLKGIANLVRQGKHEEALERCDEAYGPAVRVVQAALMKRNLGKDDLKELTREVAQLQVPALEAHLPLLGMVAQISPLLGLLGTVVGMISTFMNMNHSMGAAPISDLAGGIWEALITTAGGLCVAIPAYVAHHYLISRLNTLITDMERSGIEIVQLLKLSSGPAAASEPVVAAKLPAAQP